MRQNICEQPRCGSHRLQNSTTNQPEEKEWETIQGPAARRIWRGLVRSVSSTRSLEIRHRGSTASLRSAAPQLKIRRHPDALLNRNRQTRARSAVHARRLSTRSPTRNRPARRTSRRHVTNQNRMCLSGHKRESCGLVNPSSTPARDFAPRTSKGFR